jgi:hypothetical protein
LVDCLEVTGERWAWFDGDDRAAVLPDVVEQAGQELASLGWLYVRKEGNVQKTV